MTPPDGLNNVTAISAGEDFALALKYDGSVAAWIASSFTSYGQANVPASLGGMIAVSAGESHSLALGGRESSTAAPVILPPFKWLGGKYPFQRRIAAKNNPTSYGAGGLPTGLTVNPTTGLISGTPTQAGVSSVTISATNAGGTRSATLGIAVATPYTAWQSRVFTAVDLANPVISGDSATPMNDGVPNLIKYALNLNPKAVLVNGLPVVTIGDGKHLQLTFVEVIAATTSHTSRKFPVICRRGVPARAQFQWSVRSITPTRSRRP